ncbi:MAG: hypothetical protein GF388_00850 [Candidatus Aegiribacteria sp.]|nr:hypothetical protein [Candidatus Aegiribacteria sp.]MBD3293963.1 hypothetical protein [Candidatus Fermentibacteria bacterium]
MSLFLLTSLLLISVEPDTTDTLIPAHWTFHRQCLFQASAAGRWEYHRPFMDSTFLDAALTFDVRSPEVDILVSGAMRRDSSSSILFRRGRARVKWPGTPWIGGGVHINDVQPFAAGLYQPAVEWGWMDIDSISGFGLYGGGILDFKGSYLVQQSGGDTLRQMNIRSPWMGFAGVEYTRVRLHRTGTLYRHDAVLNVLQIRSDLRYFEPWFTITGDDASNGMWSVSGQLRDINIMDTGWGRIELVPGMHFTGQEMSFPGNSFGEDQQVLSMGAYLQSRRYMVAAGLTGMVDLQSDSLSGAEATAGMTSASGVIWDLAAGAMADGDYYADVAVGISDSYAAAGLFFSVLNDSSRVGGRASYSPRRDVCAEMEVSGDLDDSLQPSCEMAVSSALGPVTGVMGIKWNYRSPPAVTIGIRGLLR